MRFDASQIGSLKNPQELEALKSIISRLAVDLDVLYETTTPNGNVIARRGQLCLFNNSGDYQVWVNTDGDSAWKNVVDVSMLLTGDARVTVDLWLDSAGIRAPGSKPAAFVELGLTGVWEFGDEVEANQESVSGTLKIPTNMDRTVVPVFKVGWSADGVSPGNCEWQLEYLWIGVNGATNAAAQETLTVTSAASVTSNGLVIAAFSGIDLPGATDQAMFFRITRLSASGNDTISDTVEMRGRLLTYTKNKLGTPL